MKKCPCFPSKCPENFLNFLNLIEWPDVELWHSFSLETDRHKHTRTQIMRQCKNISPQHIIDLLDDASDEKNISFKCLCRWVNPFNLHFLWIRSYGLLVWATCIHGNRRLTVYSWHKIPLSIELFCSAISFPLLPSLLPNSFSVPEQLKWDEY